MFKGLLVIFAITTAYSTLTYGADLTGGRYDGTYVGTKAGSGSRCTSSDKVTRVIKSGQITLNEGANADIVLDLTTSGELYGRQRMAEITGKVEGSHLKIQLVGHSCMYIYDLIKQ